MVVCILYLQRDYATILFWSGQTEPESILNVPFVYVQVCMYGIYMFVFVCMYVHVHLIVYNYLAI